MTRKWGKFTEMKTEKMEKGYRIAGNRLQVGVCDPGGLVFAYSMWLVWPMSGMMTDHPTLAVDGESWFLITGLCADFMQRLDVYSQELAGRVLLGEVERDLRLELGYRNLTGR